MIFNEAVRKYYLLLKIKNYAQYHKLNKKYFSAKNLKIVFAKY